MASVMNPTISVENICAICKTAQDAVQNLTGEVLLVNTNLDCTHKFCKQCVEREFARKREFKCPIPSCRAMVKKNTLTEKTLDEVEASRDAQIRKEVKRIFNKTEADFPTLEAFRDYEEEVEDIIFNRVHGIDEEKMLQKISLYERDNRAVILENKAKRDTEMRSTEQRIEEELMLRKDLARSIKEEKDHLKATKKEFIKQTNQVMLGERDRVTVEDPEMQSSVDKSNSFSRFMAGSLPSTVIADLESVLDKNREDNPYLLLVSRRPYPKPTSLGPINTGKGLEFMTPCGFREANYREKCWLETVTGLLA